MVTEKIGPPGKLGKKPHGRLPILSRRYTPTDKTDPRPKSEFSTDYPQ
jgi:hypothetical protein